MAKRRLASSLGSRGYNAEKLGRLGRVCLDMHDPYEAGRHWLLSIETGPEVDAAIEIFLDRNGRKPEQIASQVMWKMRLERIEGYPEVVRIWLAELGLGGCIVRPFRARQSLAAGSTGVIGKLSLASVLIIGSVSLVLGGITILKYLYSMIR
ncbi:MAG: hypothetical protein IPK83_05705 [Planctomycetes bacterium]|nr:hypothetical protein [Planctomycetota bacterium]